MDPCDSRRALPVKDNELYSMNSRLTYVLNGLGQSAEPMRYHLLLPCCGNRYIEEESGYF